MKRWSFPEFVSSRFILDLCGNLPDAGSGDPAYSSLKMAPLGKNVAGL